MKALAIFTACSLALVLVVVAPDTVLAQGSFALTGTLNTARDAHTAAVLANGDVLVAGGQSTAGSILASAEIYDPAKAIWSLTGSMTMARYRHTETLLPNGEVLVSGGITGAGTCTATAELYNPSSGKWSATGAMPVARQSAVATLLQDGMVLVVGGACSSADNIALLYNPETGKWSQAASMNVARLTPAAVLLPDGVVVVAGNSTAELYVNGQWQLTTHMIIDLGNVAGVLLGNDDVIVFGGYPLASYISEFFDPVTATWTMARDLGVLSGSLTALANGSAFVAGGVTHYKSVSRNSYLFTGNAETVPGGSGTGTITIYPWTAGPQLNIARAEHTAVLLNSGQVLVAGGFTGGSTAAAKLASITASAELYTP